MGRMKDLAYDMLIAEDEDAYMESLATQEEAMNDYFAQMEEQWLQAEIEQAENAMKRIRNTKE